MEKRDSFAGRIAGKMKRTINGEDEEVQITTQKLQRPKPKKPLILFISERPWIPLLIVVPGLAQWFFAPEKYPSVVSLVLDALGIFLGATYMFRLGPRSRRGKPEMVPNSADLSRYSTRLLGKRFGDEDLVLIGGMILIVLVSWAANLDWPLGTNWTAIVMSGVYVAVFNNASSIRKLRIEHLAMAAIITLSIGTSFLFVDGTEHIQQSPLFYVVATAVSVGIGILFLTQRQKMLLEYQRNYLEAEMFENRISKEIARELHDSVAHEIAGITVLAQAARMMQESGTASPEKMEQALDSIESSSRRALDSIRKTVQSFNRGHRTDFSPTPTEYSDVVGLIREFEAAHSMQVAADFPASGSEGAGTGAGAGNGVTGAGNGVTGAGNGVNGVGAGALPRHASTSHNGFSRSRVLVDISADFKYLRDSEGCSPAPGYTLPDSMCTTLYRITAEALTNIHKHAPGAYVFICLRVAEGPPSTCANRATARYDVKVKHPYNVISCDRFIEDNQTLTNSVPYPRVELFIFNSSSDDAARKRHFIGEGSGMGHRNIVMRAKAHGGAAFVGSHAGPTTSPYEANEKQKGWLVFCTLPLAQ